MTCGDDLDLYFGPIRHDRCSSCGKDRGQHKAVTLNCPLGKGQSKHFYEDKFFTPKKQTSKDIA
jgi:hypothetical protein